MRARNSVRIPTAATGSCRTSRGMQWDLELADLSEGGCRIEDSRGRLRLGEFVRLYIAGTGPHMAEVAWRQGSRVGIEFARPLPRRVFTLLAAADWHGAQAAFEEDNSSLPVRRFI
ncbi:PilZ domain-containing protein [Erythrobacter sp. NFXS35]|uniref:PilZ domain-containing protein n=1 Tax=Erythrobacter sp. NFXS35 TaxID=2818436 RepID=UPI0032DE9FF3